MNYEGVGRGCPWLCRIVVGCAWFFIDFESPRIVILNAESLKIDQTQTPAGLLKSEVIIWCLIKNVIESGLMESPAICFLLERISILAGN